MIILHTVSPRINVRALIFEDAISFRKQVHALIFEQKKYFKRHDMHLYLNIKLSKENYRNIYEISINLFTTIHDGNFRRHSSMNVTIK